MDALHDQESALKDEHEANIENLRKEHASELEKCEKRFKAKMADKELDFNSKIKQLIREFQIKYSEKEREQQETVGELIAKGQREEQVIIDEYKTEIMEYQQELKLREEEMLALRKSTGERLEQKDNEISELRRRHAEALENIEEEKQQAMQEMLRKNEAEIENLQDQHQAKMEESQERFNNELEALARDRASEVAAVEKKLKTQMKKNQNEMKKLLNQKESSIQAQSAVLTDRAEPGQLLMAASSSSLNTEPNEDSSQTVLKDQISRLRTEVGALKEREESLKSQIEELGGSPVKGSANRPPQLNLVTNPLSENPTVYDTSPKSPVEPTEFEYLRNILYEFMMGRERRQMAKVLVALLRFSPKQQKEIIQKVDEQVKPGGLFSPFRS